MFKSAPLPPSTRLQRAKGRAHLGFAMRHGKTILRDLHQSGCIKALLPRNHASRLDTVFINTAGGVTGGDDLGYSASLETDSELCLTTQTAERIYKASHGTGRIATSFDVGERAKLDWLPQETILFDECALERHLEVDMCASSSVLLLEPIILGRQAMGERIERCFLSDQWRICRDGKLVYAEALKLVDPLVATGRACFGDNRAFATLLYIAPDAEARLEQMRHLLTCDAVQAAASAWNGCLVTRFIAPDALSLRTALIATLSQFRAHPLPRVWHM
ncbi:MAG: urease accessory protein UreD [Cohaesibacter sp.]|nr:urease accessory protein UreD [Cohaesibacter sp.]